jgi:osmotically inducible lipoprotein OsmB
MEDTMKTLPSLARTTVVAVGLLSLASCSGMTDSQQRMVSGGATGAVVGTVGTVLTGGCIPCGTAIGAGVGTAAGYVMDQMDKQTKSGSSNSNP